MPQSAKSLQLAAKVGALEVNNIKCWIEFSDHIVREITVFPDENRDGKYKVANVKLMPPPGKEMLVVVHWSAKKPISALCKVWVTSGVNKIEPNSAHCVMSAKVASTQIRSTEGCTTTGKNLSIGNCVNDNKEKSRITLELRRVDNVDTEHPAFDDMWCADVKEGRRPYAKFVFLLDREDCFSEPQAAVYRSIKDPIPRSDAITSCGIRQTSAVVPQEATEGEVVEISSSSSAPPSPNSTSDSSDMGSVCTPTINKKRTLETDNQCENAMSLNKSRATKDDYSSLDCIIDRPKLSTSSSTTTILGKVRKRPSSGQERDKQEHEKSGIHSIQAFKKRKICEAGVTSKRTAESEELRAPENQPGAATAAPPPASHGHCVASTSSCDRRRQARVCLMETEPDMDPTQAVAMVDYFTEIPEAANVYLDLKRSDIRKVWVRKRLAEMGYTQEK